MDYSKLSDEDLNREVSKLLADYAQQKQARDAADHQYARRNVSQNGGEPNVYHSYNPYLPSGYLYFGGGYLDNGNGAGNTPGASGAQMGPLTEDGRSAQGVSGCRT